MSVEINEVLSNAIKLVNEITYKALNSRMFEMLCEEMGFQCTRLLLHAEVRWLSTGKMLSRLFVMREEIKLLFQRQNNQKFQGLLSGSQDGIPGRYFFSVK
jgi:hypothetical protein